MRALAPSKQRERSNGGPGLGLPIPQGRPSSAVLKRDAVNRRLLAVADLLAVSGALVGLIVALGFDRLTPAGLLALPGIVLIAKILGLYDRDEHLIRKTTLEELPALFNVSAVYVLLLWLGGEFFVAGPLDQGQIAQLWVALFVTMAVLRAGARRIAVTVNRPDRVLVIGSAQNADNLHAKLSTGISFRADVVARAALHNGDKAESRAGVPYVGGLDTLGIALMENDIDRVIIAPGQSDNDAMLEAIRVTKALGVKISVLPRLFEVVGSSVKFDDIEGLTLLAVPRYGLSKSSAALKRSLDVVVSGLGLLALMPLFIPIAIAVKITSPGPVFFRQRRIGQNGVEFEMLKFRSMVDGADDQKSELMDLNEADGLFKIKNDPRITRVGKFLRNTSLDELPQLINVLRGDMSLVGPRPLVADDDARVVGWHRRRLQLTPGMTGPWQILGSSRIPLHEMVKIDYIYGADWSLWLDIKILMRTVPHILGRRGL